MSEDIELLFRGLWCGSCRSFCEETRAYVICEKSFKNHQLVQNPKNSPTITGTIIDIKFLTFRRLIWYKNNYQGL